MELTKPRLLEGRDWAKRRKDSARNFLAYCHTFLTLLQCNITHTFFGIFNCWTTSIEESLCYHEGHKMSRGIKREGSQEVKRGPGRLGDEMGYGAGT